MPSASWRFAGLTLADAPESGRGPVRSLTGGIDLVSGAASVRQSIMMLLSTIPGERVMRPDYGCPLHRIVFGPNDATTAGLAIHYVRQALIRFEPRIEILRLDAEPASEAAGSAGDGARLTVRLDYRVRGTRETDHLALNLSLAADGR